CMPWTTLLPFFGRLCAYVLLMNARLRCICRSFFLFGTCRTLGRFDENAKTRRAGECRFPPQYVVLIYAACASKDTVASPFSSVPKVNVTRSCEPPDPVHCTEKPFSVGSGCKPKSV